MGEGRRKEEGKKERRKEGKENSYLSGEQD
jgi:hypothetical protein